MDCKKEMKTATMETKIASEIRRLQKKRFNTSDYDDRYRIFLVYATVQRDLFLSETDYKKAMHEFNDNFKKPLYDWEIDFMTGDFWHYKGRMHWSAGEIASFLGVKKYELGEKSKIGYCRKKVKYLNEKVAALYLGICPAHLRILVHLKLLKSDSRRSAHLTFASGRIKEFRLQNPMYELRSKIQIYVNSFQKIDYIKQANVGINPKGDVMKLDTLAMCPRFRRDTARLKMKGKTYHLSIPKVLAHVYCPNFEEKPFIYYIDGNGRHVAAENLLCVTKEEIECLDKLKKAGKDIAHKALIEEIYCENVGVSCIDY